MNIKPLPMRDVFLEKIWNEMSLDPLIFFVSADFGSPVLDKIREDFPNRFINVGIAEQNLINITAGLAIEGYKVFAYAIAPFITMRCFEQIRVSLALLSEVRPMNVNLIGVGAGYSYVVSGPTHQCYEDITIMRALPNFQVLSPADHITTASLFDGCVATNGLRYLRLDAQVQPVLYPLEPPVATDGFHLHKKGEKVCFIATGFMTHTAFKVSEEINKNGFKVGIIDIFDLTNFTKEGLKKVLESYSAIVSFEEGFRGRGGLDSMLFEFISESKLNLKTLSIGVDPGYSFELGSRNELHEKVGIGVQSSLKKVQPFVQAIMHEIKE
jgi:transketolase